MTDDLRDLVERAHQLGELAKQPAWTLYADYVASIVAPKQRALLAGTVDDMLRYKYEAGFIQGALAALNAPEALNARLSAYQHADDASEAA